MLEFKVHKLEDWEAFVDEILPLIKHKILLLKGNLGAGKTTFSQVLVKKLGSDDEVSSPTYSIVNEYKAPEGKIFHFDLYRMNDLEEIYDIGIEEYLDSGLLSIIEWPEIYEEELEGLEYHTMKIENNNGIREISFI